MLSPGHDLHLLAGCSDPIKPLNAAGGPRTCVRGPPASPELFLFQNPAGEQYNNCAGHNHRRIAVGPTEFRHAGKVHAVPPGRQGPCQEDSGDDGRIFTIRFCRMSSSAWKSSRTCRQYARICPIVPQSPVGDKRLSRCECHQEAPHSLTPERGAGGLPSHYGCFLSVPCCCPRTGSLALSRQFGHLSNLVAHPDVVPAQ